MVVINWDECMSFIAWSIFLNGMVAIEDKVLLLIIYPLATGYDRETKYVVLTS